MPRSCCSCSPPAPCTCDNLIEPNLSLGRWVLCDRFTDATYAYQGAGRGLEVSSIRELETLVQGMRRPDLTLLLDVPVQVGLQRARERNAAAGIGYAETASRRSAQEFFERVRAAYLARARRSPSESRSSMRAARPTKLPRKSLPYWHREHGFPDRRFPALVAGAAAARARCAAVAPPAACAAAAECARTRRGTPCELDRRLDALRFEVIGAVRSVRLVCLAARGQSS